MLIDPSQNFDKMEVALKVKNADADNIKWIAVAIYVLISYIQQQSDQYKQMMSFENLSDPKMLASSAQYIKTIDLIILL